MSQESLSPQQMMTMSAEQLMLWHSGIRRWPECPSPSPCPGDTCLGACKPLTEWRGAMPAYVRYSGKLSPWLPKQAQTDAELLASLPTAEEIAAALALIQAPVLKWRVMYVETVPRQIESTHPTEAAAHARLAQLSGGYAVKEFAVANPATAAGELLKRVLTVVESRGRTT